MSDARGAEERHEQSRLRLMRAYDQVFDNPAGRIVLFDLLREGGILSASFVPGDAHATAWHDGRRSLVLAVLERLRWTEAEVLHMAVHRREQNFDPLPPETGSTRIDDAAQDELGTF